MKRTLFPTTIILLLLSSTHLEAQIFQDTPVLPGQNNGLEVYQ